MYSEVLTFWFEQLQPKDWFSGGDDTDRMITDKFRSLLLQAAQCELVEWRQHPQGRLAEIIVLDQFSRNVFRGTPQAFAQDPLALALAQEAVALGADGELSLQEKSFLYMPYMHSESPFIHQEAVRLFAQPGLEHNYDFELHHKAIIDQFGRYPHRNAILGRESTPEEVEFLKQPGSGF
ncbi:TPA: DUF924 domain-containing protein [Vibrio vulnificus]|uniref:DUF924 family protein n=1 Tax=Vibrio vulnificus TaxID=672 RepID=UPI001B815106|nr:DUF924 domain-containing protein [Vibrio vulnificus]ELM6650877.1 DUF924 domain-containing protein [Vibrio vulnificus]HBC3535280.1 DUF924 domain-containing protein [Vibrio vulnificus]